MPRGALLSFCFAASLIAAAPVPAAQAAVQAADRGPARIAIDRWLVSGAFEADTGPSPLSVDYLRGGEPDILPDRGREAGSTRWTLVRQDSADLFSLDSILGERPARAVAYAHAYLRSPSERTVRLLPRGPDCGDVDVRLNGQPLGEARSSADTIDVRLAFGWNTLLLEVLGGDCAYTFGARLLAGIDGLDEVRVQASRPPGDARAFPAPSLTVPPLLEIEPSLAWQADELLARLALPLTAWGSGPIDSVRIRFRLGGTDERSVARDLRPATVTSLAFILPFDALRKGALQAEAVRLDLRWGRDKAEPSVSIAPESLLRTVHAPIRLVGWGPGAVETAARSSEAPGDPPLPTGSGVAVGGKWKVPRELAGFTLLLDAGGAPGSYRLGSGQSVTPDTLLTLCRGCRRGQEISIHATSSAAWSSYPTVRVAEPGYPAAADAAEAPDAQTWLRALGEKRNERYLELSARFGRETAAEGG
ncbi:MAG: hypothetical protein ACE5JR_02725 [Gemmatimonadota bacterium]